MSDYQHSNSINRSDGLSARGIFITLGVVVMVFVVLVAIGSSTRPAGERTPVVEIAPAATDSTAPIQTAPAAAD